MSRSLRTPAAPLPVTLVAVLALVAVRPHAQMATAPMEPQLLLITETELKPETATEWTDVQKAEVVPALKKGGLAWRDTWTGTMAGNPYVRGVVTPISNLSQFDGPSPVVKALGEDGAQALSAKTRRLIAHSRGYVIRTRPDIGFGTRPAEFKLAILTTTVAMGSRAADFEAFLKADIVPALKKANVSYYAVSQVVYGGNANTYQTLLPIADFAELAKGHPLERALGPDGMLKLQQKAGSMVLSLEREIIRYVPELSFRPSGTVSQ